MLISESPKIGTLWRHRETGRVFELSDLILTHNGAGKKVCALLVLPSTSAICIHLRLSSLLEEYEPIGEIGNQSPERATSKAFSSN